MLKKDYIKCIIEFIEKYYYIFLVGIIALSAFNAFYKIGQVPIIHYDEARHGASAYEMLKNKEFIINTFNYENDYWNLKPPLSFWMIILGYKLVGFNVIGLRLYSSISSILTVFLIVIFVKHKHGKFAAVISGWILATTVPMITFHCSRSADADSLYIFLFTIAMISMILINKNIKFLYLAGFSAALAFLTKSWHGFNIVIIGALYIFISGTFLKLKLKEWFIFLISYISPILLWVIMRISKDGLEFLKAMVEYDLLKRSSQAIEGHIGGLGYYFNFILMCYGHWIILLIPVVFYCINRKKQSYNKEIKNYILAVFLWIVVPLAIYTNAKTKIQWYILPVYPALAILCGVFFAKIIKEKRTNEKLKLALISLIIILSVTSEVIIYRNISRFTQDKIECTLKVMKDLDGYKNYKIYTQDGVAADQGIWEQGHIFAAELYGDLIPVKGGFEAFLENKDSRALIIAPATPKTEKIIEENNLTVILKENGRYVILNQALIDKK
jgi:4-amino-4-deoxy-L-arabinose transferase-like glycosyltransferase